MLDKLLSLLQVRHRAWRDGIEWLAAIVLPWVLCEISYLLFLTPDFD